MKRYLSIVSLYGKYLPERKRLDMSNYYFNGHDILDCTCEQCTAKRIEMSKTIDLSQINPEGNRYQLVYKLTDAHKAKRERTWNIIDTNDFTIVTTTIGLSDNLLNELSDLNEGRWQILRKQKYGFNQTVYIVDGTQAMCGIVMEYDPTIFNGSYSIAFVNYKGKSYYQESEIFSTYTEAKDKALGNKPYVRLEDIGDYFVAIEDKGFMLVTTGEMYYIIDQSDNNISARSSSRLKIKKLWGEHTS